jgi:hypothetical protein
MKHKVKKFGRGGDIVTGLGAVLLGKALYDKYKGSKDQDTSKDSGPRNEGSGESTPKPRIESMIKDKSSESTVKNKSDDSSYAPDSKFGPKDIGFGGGVDDGIKPKRKPKPKSGPAAQSTTSSSSSSQGVIDADKQQKSAVENKPKNPALNRAGLSGKGITMPGDPNAKGSTFKGRSANPIQETIDSRGKGMARTPQQKMAEGAREVERRRQAEKKKKDDEANMKGALKKGGAVKKYASGGSVSSASKRADGIAIRGKTRA